MPFIATAIGAVAGAIGAAATAVGSFVAGIGAVGQLALTIGLNVAVALLSPKPPKPKGGVSFDRDYGEDVPRRVACGLCGIAGHDVYVNTYGKSNKYLQQIYVLSDYYTTDLTHVAINGAYQTIGTVADPDKGYPVTSGDFANKIWVKFFDGRQTAADQYLIDNAHPADRWSAAHIGLGMSFVLVSMTYDQKKNNQFPDFFFEFKGAPLYDWRKDSTVGGSGSHRLADPTTHEYSENPIVQQYNYRVGFSINGDLFCGMGMSVSDLPLAKWTAAANICDETVDDEMRYACSVVFDAMSTHKDNIQGTVIACGAMIVDGVDGSWPIVGSEQTPIITFTDDDLISSEAVKYRGKRSMADLVNSVSGNFPQPDQLWSMVGYNQQTSSALVTVDRRTRDLNIDFPQVRSGRQAEQLASIYLYENRYEANATVTLRPRFQTLQTGDWVNWNSARYGLKTYIVTNNVLTALDSDGPRNNQLQLQQRDGSIYDGITPPSFVVPLPPGAPDYLNEVAGYSVLAVITQGDDGTQAPGIRVAWNTIDDETVIGVQLRYYPTSQTDKIFYKTVTRDQTVVILTEGVINSTEYMVQAILLTNPQRTTVWNAGITVTTDTIPHYQFPISREDLDNLLKDFVDFTTPSIILANDRYRDILDQLQNLANGVDDLTLTHYNNVQSIRREVTVTTNEMSATFDEKIDVATGPTGSIAQQLVALSTKIDGKADAYALQALSSTSSIQGNDIAENARAITQLTASIAGKADATALQALSVTVTSQGGQISTLTDAMTLVQSSVNDATASGLFRVSTAYSAPSGWTLRAALELRLTTGSTFKNMGMFFDMNATQSRILFKADQFIITDGTAIGNPFVYTGGALYLDVANITTIRTGRMLSLDGKVDFNLTSKYFDWYS